MKIFAHFLKYFIYINIFILLSACTGGEMASTKSGYSRLCEIYTEVLGTKQTPAETSARLSEKIKKELPDIYPHFRRVLMSDPNVDGYSLFTRLAQANGEKNWECKAMKDYLSAVK